jgi:pullulanase/glycogen debranching enzyme
VSILGFGQGIPFYHAGVELLRSKSMDRNSYNSGDWFNKLDFTYNANNWGVGLPPAGDNQSNWPILQPLLANPALKPGRTDILTAYTHFLETLAIRRSTPLFRLRTGDDVKNRVRFYNAGPSQIPGLIVMSVADADGGVDRAHNQVVVVVNANKNPATYADAAFTGKALKLHPVQQISLDAAERNATFTSGTGSFSVPGRTASVFWSNRPAADQIALLIQDVANLVAAGTISNGHGTALTAKLEAAQQQAQADHATPASGQLLAFINQVQVLAGQGSLPQDDADALVTNAYVAIAGLFL